MREGKGRELDDRKVQGKKRREKRGKGRGRERGKRGGNEKVRAKEERKGGEERVHIVGRRMLKNANLSNF